MPDAVLTLTPHTTVRLDVAVSEPFGAFRERYEAAVPPFTPDILGEGDGWEAISERTLAAAPHGFLYYARLDAGPFFGRAGHTTPCTTYLMGNHVIAETMFRHDPAVLLYAPLRTAIYGDAHGQTHFTIDQPSGRFASFGHPEIAATGRLLDEKLSGLLSVLGIAVSLETSTFAEA